MSSGRSPAKEHKPNFFKPVSAIKCIVLDIDETIVYGLTSRDNVKFYQYVKYVKNEHPEQFIPLEYWVEGDRESMDHVLCPGVIEWVRHIIAMNYQLAFFSAGLSGRNNEFVKVLLQRALSPEEYKKVKENIPVFSRNDLFDTGQAPELKHHYQDIRYKKDLNVVIEFFSEKGISISLDEIVLVDDYLGNAMPEQERNICRVPGFSLEMDQQFLKDEQEEKCYFQSNQIFYMAGLLHAVSSKPKAIDVLYALQKESDSDKDPVLDINYYKTGLLLLKKINPKLDFFDLEAVASYKDPPVVEPGCCCALM